MTKKDDIKGLASIGKGILSSLEDIEGIKEETSKKVDKEKSIQLNKEKKKEVKEEICEGIKEEKSKKTKKNFMLTDNAIDQLFELKFKYRKKDYSQIVEESINEYYKKYI